ncbi:origin recognition complex subunit 2-domain-containing protein [Cyathus striatus]|nr:origin recognition complex subunit 2-domain-containing protein [Cyathus striatus]
MPRLSQPKFQSESSSSSSEGEIDLEEVSDSPSEDEQDHVPVTPSKRKGKAKAAPENDFGNSQIIVQTSFDAYITYTAARAQTSTNVFSQLVMPLSAEEYSDAIAGIKDRRVVPAIATEPLRSQVFERFMFELDEGFNILCYGFGSKRKLLNDFATEYCSKSGYVVVANGFQPDFSLKDLLNSIENVPGIQDVEITSSAVDGQAQRIYEFFARPEQKIHLYLIIHNIDAAPLRAAKAKSILSFLALNPRIHIVASVDHINAPLLWSSYESAMRKPDNVSESDPVRGFSWLWHDLTTLESYDFELAFTDKASISGAHGGGPRRKADAAAAGAAAMSETAALHILASVTQKAQKLFSLLGTKQLESIDEAGEGAGTQDLQQFGLSYDALFNAARDNFIATNDTALRSLLGEFRDHGLVVSAQAGSGGGEVLWIPLRKERLVNVLQSLQVE